MTTQKQLDDSMVGMGKHPKLKYQVEKEEKPKKKATKKAAKKGD